MQKDEPDLVEGFGAIDLAIAFAPPEASAEEAAGKEFTNKHGARQRYSDPREQSILGGDIGAKNTLDKNYLHLAQKHGAEIRPLCEADKIEPLEGGGYRVSYKTYSQESTGWGRFRRKWLRAAPQDGHGTCTAKRLVLAAGYVGSTELLLRNRDVHQTLPDLSPSLGERYTTNGDFISLLFPSKGIAPGWDSSPLSFV